jgi:ABC-type spermidine/putrescine transport system permease subunit II
MTATAASSAKQGRGSGKTFGVPLSDFGFFSSLLLSFSLGFGSFFLATFLAIVALLFYNEGGHHNVDFADTYKFVGLPVGLVVLVLSLVFFGSLWIRRKVWGR